MDTKCCKGCRRDLPVEEFHKKGAGWHPLCRTCRVGERKALYARRRDRESVTCKAWAGANKSRRAGYNKALHETKADEIINALHAATSQEERLAYLRETNQNDLSRYSRVAAVIREYSMSSAEVILRDQVVTTYERLKDNTPHRMLFTVLLTMAMGSRGGSRLTKTFYKSDEAESLYADGMEEIEQAVV